MEINLLGSDARPQHFHFIGIGGISMSGLAGWLLASGMTVSGSDQRASHLTDELAALGMNITIGHTAEEIAGADVVVLNAAIKADNPALAAARGTGVPLLMRADLLAQIMAMHPLGIGISGTHGKTTTTSMLATVFLTCGEDPSLHIGGELPLIGGTTRRGQGPAFICEADEYNRSFLSLRPKNAIITNIEHDHPDIFPTMDSMLQAFCDFAALLPPDGVLLVNGDDESCRKAAAQSRARVVTFGFGSNCDYRACQLQTNAQGHMQFSFCAKGLSLAVTLAVPGQYNVANATAALAMAHLCGLSMPHAIAAIGTFTHTKRRFERMGKTPAGAAVINDYAHHPTEVRCVLQAAKSSCSGKVFLVFQPHTYSRTAALLSEYAEAAAGADASFICDIWAAREPDLGVVHARDIAALAGPTCRHAPSFESLAHELRETCGPEDIIVCAGAGDIERMCSLLLREDA